MKPILSLVLSSSNLVEDVEGGDVRIHPDDVLVVPE